MIVLFCGIPGSGKTTITDILAARLATLGRVKVLSSDRVKPPVYRRMFKMLETERGAEDFLLLDATFYKKDWRERIEVLARGEKVLTVYLDCPRAVALERNRERRSQIAERALHIVYHRMEPPEFPSLKIDTQSTSAEAAAERIFDLMKRADRRSEERL